LTLFSGSGDWIEVARLLERARQLLFADEATLLLLDNTDTALVPVASSGLESPVHARFRVPVGAGFAGRIAATGQPLALSDVNEQTVLNPVLQRSGMRSLLGVPVPGRPRPLGVLHVGALTPRLFTDADIRPLEQIAAELAIEVRRRRATEEHIAALALQRSLLPTMAARIEGLDIAARYIPAEGDLGGDWYDVFRLPGDRIGIVMGDVAGHGLAAAVVMGRLRSALRAYALEHPDPAEVLRLLDIKISYFEAGAVATVLYAVAEPPFADFAFSSAGHLPPFVVQPGSAPQVADVAPDPPLGVPGPWIRHTTTVNLPLGATLCLFTDGLIERRPTPDVADADQFSAGLERLHSALRPGDTNAACTALVADLIGDDVTEDDVAILLVRRPKP
jgi:serine phosphatase RsbU (regulator of sigma subunit)